MFPTVTTMTPPATEPVQGWVIRFTWEVTDPDMAHPKHSYLTKPARGLAEAAAWDAWRRLCKGLTLEEIHLRRDSDGPWELFLPRECTACVPASTADRTAV
jgi:hypothetical protein